MRRGVGLNGLGGWGAQTPSAVVEVSRIPARSLLPLWRVSVGIPIGTLGLWDFVNQAHHSADATFAFGAMMSDDGCHPRHVWGPAEASSKPQTVHMTRPGTRQACAKLERFTGTPPSRPP